MEPINWKILLVDDDEDDYFLTRQMLSEARHGSIELDWASTYTQGRQYMLGDGYDAVLVDYDLGAHTGIDLIREIDAAQYPAPIILLTGRGSYEVDVEAMQAGATLYLTKSEANPLLLERGIRYAIEFKQNADALRQANAELRQELEYRRQIERALADSQERFRSVIENALDAAYRRNLQSDMYDYLSPVIEQLVGFTPAEMKYMPISDILARVHLDDLPAIEAALEQASRDRQGCLEYRFLCKDGQYRWLSDNVSMAYDEEGRPLYRSGIVRDISAAKRVQATLQARAGSAMHMLADERARLEAVLEAVPAAVVIVEAPEGKVALANRQTAALTGRPLPAGQPASQALKLYQPGGQPFDLQESPLDRALQGEATQSTPALIERADGTRVPVMCRAAPVRGQAGEISAGVVILYHKTAESAGAG